MVVSRTPHMTDYEAERRGFHLEVPEYFNFATDVIGKWASDPNKLLLGFLQETYAAAAKLANWDRKALEREGAAR